MSVSNRLSSLKVKMRTWPVSAELFRLTFSAYCIHWFGIRGRGKMGVMSPQRIKWGEQNLGRPVSEYVKFL